MLRFSVHVWMLWLLCAGTFSDEDVNGCEQQPCQNGGLCESHNGGFRCLCSQQSQSGRLYGGETCTIALSGCDDNQCENGGICSPLLVNDQHTYTCICLAGFTGPKCETTTVFSFESRGYMRIETQLLDPEALLNVTFSFRTERPAGTLLQRRMDDLLLSIELMDGHLCLRSMRGQGSSTLVQELPEYMSDNKWHTVEAALGDADSLIRLLCTEASCTRDTSAEVQLLEQASAALPQSETARQSLFIGAVRVNWGFDRAAQEADDPPAFVGCFRDVFVDSHLVVPVIKPEDLDGQANVTVGCSDRDKCDDKYITARFGSKDLESYAAFSLDDDPGDTVTISMFIRTRQPSGLLLILANSSSQYLRLWLEEGRVKVQVNNFETLVGRGAVTDGHFHLVTVKLEGMAAILFQSSQTQSSMPIREIQAHFGDMVFVGGLPDPSASAPFGGYFNGCVQDLRINSKRLQFYPITTSVKSYDVVQLINVAQGCSSDNACADNPCLNSGVCYSTWEDFICNCPPNTAGQRCEEVKWCELSPCPATAVCQPFPQGFECLSNVTFRAESEVLLYRSNRKINRSLTGVSLSFRTRQFAATILHAQKGSTYLTVSLQDSHVVMEHQGNVDKDSLKLTVQSQGSVSDGEWHTVELSMENQTSIWIMAVDGDKEELSKINAGDLDFLREGADIFLGGMSLDTRVSLSGCLGPIKIGGLLLPFHLDTELNLPRPQEEQFVRINVNASPQYGCWGASVCAPNPCQNEGACEDLFDLHHCVCPSEWTGPLCQDLTDTCASSPCIYGNCTNLSGGYKCVCQQGYSGEQCETEVDLCANSNCSSGATCLKGFQSYVCVCPQNLTGQYCDEKIPEIPWYIEINPCEKDVDECVSDPCMNGGFCVNYVNRFECVCDMNYSGIHCQIDVSDFYLYLFLGLWQNLFQLVSYLIIRLDDEPEIEWGFPVND
ncbi:hypothetical protein PAMA_005309 [Pampus argenteus]